MRQSLQNLNKADISVIVVSYNTKVLTLQCIKSVKEEGPSVTKEIIVIDNGSTDSSVASLRKLQITLIENKNNQGFAKAVNQGIEIASGKYILLLNSDTVIPKGAIEKLLRFAQGKNEAGVISTKLLNADGSIQASCFYFPTIKRAILQYFFGHNNYFDKYVPKTKTFVIVDSVVGAVFLITPEALKKVGLLDERYFMYFEDIDYCRRVKKAGLKVYYYAGVSVTHLHGASGKNLADEKDQWRRLIPSSKIYHGVIYHYVLNLILWSGQKWQKYLKKAN